jgi:hypothetical protein
MHMGRDFVTCGMFHESHLLGKTVRRKKMYTRLIKICFYNQCNGLKAMHDVFDMGIGHGCTSST